MELEPKTESPHVPETVELPAPTVWRIVFAFGLTLVFDVLLTSAVVSVFGAVLSIIAGVGWFVRVLPHEASFFLAGVFFWWPVIEPWPSVSRYSRWYIVLYLFLATLPCDALSAYLAFCDKVVYRGYLSVPHFNMSAMQDQQCAGALMWVFVTFAYLLPAVLLTANLLGSSDNETGEPDVEGFCRCAEDPELASALPRPF
jgi:hypothetical protein